jgi:hypothetical protein
VVPAIVRLVEMRALLGGTTTTWPINWKLFVAVLIGFVLLVVFHLTGQVRPSATTSGRAPRGPSRGRQAWR